MKRERERRSPQVLLKKSLIQFSASQIGLIQGPTVTRVPSVDFPSSQGPERLSDMAGNDYCGIQGIRRRSISFPSLCALHRDGIWSVLL
jgi:hypothetical protein